jgi:hypothetical protein
MKILKENEVKAILAEGKSLSDYEISTVLDELEREQPEIYHVIYGELPDGIAQINKDMANLFLDLSFDVIWVFKKAFGKPPLLTNGEEWVANKISLLDAELKSLVHDRPMNAKIRRNLQERFVKRSFGTAVQIGLLKHLENEVISYASFKHQRVFAIHVTTNLLFVLVRLMGDLYSLKPG